MRVKRIFENMLTALPICGKLVFAERLDNDRIREVGFCLRMIAR